MYPNVKTFVEESAKKVGFIEFLLPFIPMLADMLAAFIEQCSNTEAEACDMLTEPSPFQARIMHWKLVQAMRRDGSIPARKRRAYAWQLLNSGVEVANDKPELVTAAVQDARAA